MATMTLNLAPSVFFSWLDFEGAKDLIYGSRARLQRMAPN